MPLVDPIPSGAKIQGTGLDNDGGQGPQGVTPDYYEMKDAGFYGSYYEISSGTFTMSYQMRMNNPGTFKMPTTRIEATTAPDNFAEVPNTDITVVP